MDTEIQKQGNGHSRDTQKTMKICMVKNWKPKKRKRSYPYMQGYISQYQGCYDGDHPPLQKSWPSYLRLDL